MENSNNKTIPIVRMGSEIKKISEVDDYNNKFNQSNKDLNYLSVYYNKKSGNGNILDRIGKLNKKFYNCTDKYIRTKKIMEKLNDDLYLNLFQQIDIYVEEIVRLNKKLGENNNEDLKKTIEKLNKEINEKKEKIRHYENKIKEKTQNEEKLKKEIESYKRSLIFYKDKIKIGLLVRNGNSANPNNVNSNCNRKKNSLSNKPGNVLSSKTEKNVSFFFNNKDANGKLEEENEKEKIVTEEGGDNEEPKINKYFQMKMKESIAYQIHQFNNNNKYDKDIEELNVESDNNNNNDNDDDDFDFLKDKVERSRKKNKEAEEGKLIRDNSLKFNSVFLSTMNKELNDNNRTMNEKSSKEEKAIKFENKEKLNNTPKLNNNLMKKINKASRSTYKKENLKAKMIKMKPNINNNYNMNKIKPHKTYRKSREKLKENDTNMTFSNIKSKNKKINNNLKTETGNELNKFNISSFKKNKKLMKMESNDANNNKDKSYNGNKRHSGGGFKSSYNLKEKEKNKDKEMKLILKDVNDDYLKSIEMLTKQEEQIKYMLSFIDLDDDDNDTNNNGTN